MMAVFDNFEDFRSTYDLFSVITGLTKRHLKTLKFGVCFVLCVLIVPLLTVELLELHYRQFGQKFENMRYESLQISRNIFHNFLIVHY